MAGLIETTARMMAGPVCGGDYNKMQNQAGVAAGMVECGYPAGSLRCSFPACDCGSMAETVITLRTGAEIEDERLAAKYKAAGEGARPADWEAHWPTDLDLMGRAVRNAGLHRFKPRWLQVANLFGCGSTVAMALCRRFGLDPDELAKRKR